MQAAGYRFGDFTLLSAQGPLLRGGVEIKLQPKTLTLLWTLVRQAGEVVSKSALFDAVWPQRIVVETALSFQIQLLRTALGDNTKSPRYIATVHRIGFRFLAAVATTATVEPVDSAPAATIPLLGRARALQQLHASFARSLGGRRQLVFVTGEAGIGKTALIDRFIEELRSSRSDLLLARGQSVEHYGEGEPYLPVLEALSQLCRHDDGHVLELLRQRAPAWLGQLSSLLSAGERAELQAQAAGASSARQQRELTDVLDHLCAGQPLLMVLEDLHWSDSPSIELLTMIAQRQDKARLLVICTYRPVEAIVSRHPVNHLKLSLAARRQCEELPLPPLQEADTAEYLSRRFPERPDLGPLAAAVHRHSGGLPLFMVQMAEVLPGVSAEAFEAVVPQELRGLVGLQLERLEPAEQEVLEAASVEGSEFTAACVAAVLGLSATEAETHCDRLVRHGQFIEDRGLAVWPDGTASGRYGFRHALYQAVLYRRMSAGRRRQMHLRIGERLEAGCGDRQRDSAVELAAHFSAAQEGPRAARFHELAGEVALQRCAPQLAATHFRRAIDGIASLPDETPRLRRELGLQLRLGAALIDGRGYTAPEVSAAFQRASQLSGQLADEAQLSSALWGQYLFHLIRAEFGPAQQIATRLLEMAEGAPGDAETNLRARLALGAVLFFRGELEAAWPHFELGLDLCDLDLQNFPSTQARDLRVECAATAAWLLWMRGYPDQARARSIQALSLASEGGVMRSLDVALFRQSVLHLLLQDGEARQTAEALRRHARDNGLVHWEFAADILLHADSASHDAKRIEELRRAVEARKSMGVGLGAVLDLVLLARAHAQLGQVAEGLCVVAEARELIQAKGERLWEADLHIVEAELRAQGRQSDSLAAAERCLAAALEVSRRQGAKSWALRAALGLNGLRQGPGQALPAVAETFRELTEGFGTADLARARALLA